MFQNTAVVWEGVVNYSTWMGTCSWARNIFPMGQSLSPKGAHAFTKSVEWKGNWISYGSSL